VMATATDDTCASALMLRTTYVVSFDVDGVVSFGVDRVV
jgi:hypothetical protein